MTRLDQLLTMLKNEPNDVFLRYAIGMEYKGLGENQTSLEYFLGLTSQQHVPSFFMAAQVYTDEGMIEPAREMLRLGIDQARTQGDRHAAAEMGEFLATLGALGE